MTVIREALATWHERREREREIAHITPQEIADYGLSPQEFRDIALMPEEQIRRMEEMARLNGLDPARLDDDRPLQIAVALTCAHCQEQGRCRRALRDGADRDDTDFCNNSETYRMLAAE
ncbi:DUF6455 family protein [Rubellimicrobium aerolatum]|uniref:DUF6455 family protein n=1 Tax=Rubellimicrobium aerolatum TaxID=490979 RepID=A0ABW0S9K9_9RHOB|nr:DUF6455 family protein [Rubellimicrobium aerolatum]MBP1804967.1 uncharacterized protein YjiS (DUF1127 family) [Rubellimicrobium aerolatum]